MGQPAAQRARMLEQLAALLGEAAPGIDSVREIGRRLFTDYALAFEATSLLILVAMVGAVVIAGKRTDEGTGQ